MPEVLILTRPARRRQKHASPRRWRSATTASPTSMSTRCATSSRPPATSRRASRASSASSALGVRNACSLALQLPRGAHRRDHRRRRDHASRADRLRRGAEAGRRPRPLRAPAAAPRGLPGAQRRARARDGSRRRASRASGASSRRRATSAAPRSIRRPSRAYETADRLQALTTSGESIVWRPGSSRQRSTSTWCERRLSGGSADPAKAVRASR